MSLRNKTILILLFISVVPIFVVGYIETVNARRVLEKQFGNDGVEFGRYVLWSIQKYLYYVFKDVHEVSHSISMEDISGYQSREQMEQISDVLKYSDINYAYIIIRDTSGKKVAVKNRKMVGEEFFGKRGFTEALDGKPNIQQPCYDAFARQYVMMVSFPITDITKSHDYSDEQLKKEEVRGVLMVALKWSKINRVVGGTRNRAKQRDTTNQVVLMNSDGLVLFSADPNMIFTTNLVELGMESAKKAVQGEKGYLTEINEHGEESFIAYTRFRGSKIISNTGWSVLVERDPELVFASVTAMRKTLAYAIAGCVLVLVLFSVFFGGQISRPILALSEAAKAFGGGDLSRRVKVSRRDEIGTLGASFNLMAEQVEKYSESLVSEVHERRKTEVSLLESKERYRGLIENIDSGFALHEMIYDEDGAAVDYRYLQVNPAYMKLAGVDDPTGKTVREVYPNIEQRWIDIYDEIVRTGVARDFQQYHSDVGKWWQIYGYKVAPDQFACVFYDITDLKKGQEKLQYQVSEQTQQLQEANKALIDQMSELREYEGKLRSLASKLTLTEEHERHRIASGLHDSIIQPLIFLRIKLDTLIKKDTSDEQLESIVEMRKTIGELTALTRDFVFDLSYPVLYEFGLETAIEDWLTEEFGEKHGINTELCNDGSDKPLSDDLRSFLFESVRELLVNIAKHANAKNVEVDISRQGDIIVIEVKDDGIGFEVSEKLSFVSKGSGFGLFSIRERLSYFNGSFEIDTSPGHGTVVLLKAPLKK